MVVISRCIYGRPSAEGEPTSQRQPRCVAVNPMHRDALSTSSDAELNGQELIATQVFIEHAVQPLKPVYDLKTNHLDAIQCSLSKRRRKAGGKPNEVIL